jgi:hypothetical protein
VGWPPSSDAPVAPTTFRARPKVPLVFYEEGGFAYRQIFNLPYFLLDIFGGLDFAVMSGFIGRWYEKRKNSNE